MSESYSIIPLNAQVREWLREEGIKELLSDDGRPITFDELKTAVGSLTDLEIEWDGHRETPTVSFSAPNGLYTSLKVNAARNESGHCELYFRGGHTELIERIVTAIADVGGPQVIYEHSGSFTRVVHVG